MASPELNGIEIEAFGPPVELEGIEIEFSGPAVELQGIEIEADIPFPDPPGAGGMGAEIQPDPISAAHAIGLEIHSPADVAGQGLGVESEDDPNFAPLPDLPPGEEPELAFDDEEFSLEINPASFQMRVFAEIRGIGVINVSPLLANVRRPRVLVMKPLSGGTGFSVSFNGGPFGSTHFTSLIATFSQEYPVNLDVNMTDLGGMRFLLLGDA
jgi:hypothetical protein